MNRADEPGSRLLVPSAMPDTIAVAVGSAVPDAHALLELYGDVEDDRDDTGGSTP